MRTEEAMFLLSTFIKFIKYMLIVENLEKKVLSAHLGSTHTKTGMIQRLA